MEVSGYLRGGTPVLQKYQIAETFTNAGVIGTIDVSGEAGVNLVTTANAVDMVGVSHDAGTYSTTQGTGTSSAESVVTFDIRPDAIIRARMSGGATSGTSLSAQTETTGETDGLVVTTGATWSSPTFLDGTVWGLTGNNVGQDRKITAVDGTTGTVDVPFDNNILINDTYLRAPFHPHSSVTVELVTDFTEVDASAAISGDAELACVYLLLNGVGDSYAFFTSKDHFFGPST